MTKSKIEWTDETWNPVTGCSKVSNGCKHCYAERQWARLSNISPVYHGRKFTDVECHPERLEQPLRWKRPRKVFVNSMSDLFHPDVPSSFIKKVFEVMLHADNHIFQILTKRPEYMLNWFNEFGHIFSPTSDPLPNVWLGVSVEDQATADERIPLLLQTPAAVRWVSAEPLLGPVDIYGGDPDPRLGGVVAGPGVIIEQHWKADGSGPFPGINWVVVGGESGPKARPMHPDWVRSLRDQCKAAGVPFLFKQWGEWQADENRVPTDIEDAEGNAICIGIDGNIPGTGYNREKTIPARMFKIGKKAAGRLLDGVLHDEYP